MESPAVKRLLLLVRGTTFRVMVKVKDAVGNATSATRRVVVKG
jgi:hypothetical protein